VRVRSSAHRAGGVLPARARGDLCSTSRFRTPCPVRSACGPSAAVLNSPAAMSVVVSAHDDSQRWIFRGADRDRGGRLRLTVVRRERVAAAALARCASCTESRSRASRRVPAALRGVGRGAAPRM